MGLLSKIFRTGMVTEPLQVGDADVMKLIVAAGDCARACGVFAGSYAVAGTVDRPSSAIG